MKTVTFEVIKDIYWDNWGHLTKVFNKGDICVGNLKDGIIISESPYYKGIIDVVPNGLIRIISEKESSKD